MASRMDRYRNQELETTGMRPKRNEHLYARVEAPLEYSSVEGVARIDNTNSVDINKIKELLLREEEPKKKHHSKMEKQETLEDTSELVTFNQLEDKNYDIRDILNKAKDEKEEDDDDKYRNLQNTGYDILKNIQVQKKPTEISDQELNHVGDTTLSLSMLDNLQDNEEEEITETMSSKTIRDLLNEETSKEEDDDDDDFEEQRTLDNSFFTSSLNFSEEDFNELSDELDEPKKKENLIVKVLIFIIMVVLTTVAIFVLANYLK